jgi:trehalose-phosphatase
MKYLFDEWDSIVGRLGGAHLLLMLDFDGTLAPIAPTPEEAALPAETRALLARLASGERCTVAVVSGREIGDLKRKVELAGIVYVGNHGLEVDGADTPAECAVPPDGRETIERLVESLGSKLERIPGILIEDKGSAVAVHYRLAGADYAPSVETAVREAVLECDAENVVAVSRGKRVVELRPRTDCDKGKVVSSLFARERRRRDGEAVVPLYVGDDITDEDAFESLAEDGITVYVGKPGCSRARYYVRSAGEVAKLLERLVERCGKAR